MSTNNHRDENYKMWLSKVRNDPNELRNAPEQFKNDKDLVKLACGSSLDAFEFASKELRSDKEFILKICQPASYGHYGGLFFGTVLQFVSKNVLDDKDVILAACRQNGRILQRYASDRLRADKDVVMAAVARHPETLVNALGGLHQDPDCIRAKWLSIVCQDARQLANAPAELQSDPSFVFQSCQESEWVFEFASSEMKNDKDIALEACKRRGEALKYASKRLRADKDVVKQACNLSGLALEYASDKKLRDDKDVVAVACQQHGLAIKLASERLRNDKDVAFVACRQDWRALEWASEKLRNDKDIISVACKQNRSALQWANNQMRDDKCLLLELCKEDGLILELASEKLKDDNDVVHVACRQNYRALQWASSRLKDDKDLILKLCFEQDNDSVLELASAKLRDDKEVVWKACDQDGWALQFASTRLRADKDIVLAAVTSTPESLKYALGGLNQDVGCLIKCGIWDREYGNGKNLVIPENNNTTATKIVLSTRFSLKEESTSRATQFTLELKHHEYFKSGNFLVYSPNAFDKSTCDPEWTRFEWPCRGTYDTCKFDPSLKTGVPKLKCCWRYSFRCQLEEAKRTNGFMVQIADFLPLEYEHRLGDGQTIERDMAQNMGVKIFRVNAPYVQGVTDTQNVITNFTEKDIENFVFGVQDWYEGNCSDMSECTIQQINYLC